MNDDEMRTLLEDAVAEVEPRYALADIRSRTATRRRRSWAWGAAGAAVATAATVAAVVALGNVSGGDTSPAPTGQEGTGAGPTVEVYYVGSTGAGPRLFPELAVTGSRATMLDDALTEAVRGGASDSDYHTPWPAGTTVRRAQLRGGVLSVDLSGAWTQRPSGMSRTAAVLAVQQLVYTAQSATGSRLPVTFLDDGRHADSLLGVSVRRPVPAAPAEGTVTAVSVTSPPDGATEDGPFTVEGKASTFEGNVQWELLRNGTVVKRGYATATQCCTLSPYSFRVTAQPGDYTLVVHDEDVSDGEGNGTTQDTKRITVR